MPYFQIVGHSKNHINALLEPNSYEEAAESVKENKMYEGGFIANSFPPDSLCFIDFIDVFSGNPVFSKKFVDFLRLIGKPMLFLSKLILCMAMRISWK